MQSIKRGNEKIKVKKSMIKAGLPTAQVRRKVAPNQDEGEQELQKE